MIKTSARTKRPLLCGEGGESERRRKSRPRLTQGHQHQHQRHTGPSRAGVRARRRTQYRAARASSPLRAASAACRAAPRRRACASAPPRARATSVLVLVLPPDRAAPRRPRTAHGAGPIPARPAPIPAPRAAAPARAVARCWARAARCRVWRRARAPQARHPRGAAPSRCAPAPPPAAQRVQGMWASERAAAEQGLGVRTRQDNQQDAHHGVPVDGGSPLRLHPSPPPALRAADGDGRAQASQN